MCNSKDLSAKSRFVQYLSAVLCFCPQENSFRAVQHFHRGPEDVIEQLATLHASDKEKGRIIK